MTRAERTYYLVCGLYNLSWSCIAPLYALFLLSRGLDLFQINAVLSTYLLTAFLFEVPTGAVADLYGRKVSFLLSCLVRAAAFALYAVADSFPAFLFAEFVDAVGTTLATGALDAWAVDGMRAEGDHRPTDRLFARAQVLSRVLMIVSGLVAGYVGEYDLTLPWLMGTAGFAVTALTGAVLMRENQAPVAAAFAGWRGVTRSLGQTVRDGLGHVQAVPVLRLLCALTLATAFAIMPVHQLWQPRMQGLSGQGAWLMGWIWALINLTAMTGSMLIPRLLHRFSRASVMAAAALWRALAVALAAVATALVPALAGLLLQEISFGLSEPVLQSWMNERLRPEQRATVLSVRSMSFTLGGATGLICLGLVARAADIPTAWLCSTAVLALTVPGFLVLGRAAQRAADAEAAAPAVTVVKPVVPPACG